MKIVTIKGGLGNQIFQYLFYLYLKKKQKNVYIYLESKGLKNHNGWELNRWFELEDINQPYYLFINVLFFKILDKLKLLRKITESNYKERGFLYDGYWQDKKYYSDNISNLIFKNIFLSEENKKIITKITSVESVSIHIRRGDYMSAENYPIYGNVCTKQYYQKAISIIEKEIANPVFFIFSNDIDWVKNNLSCKNAVYIDWNSGENSFYDMYLMTHCKHHIIANSSFSFWGAMLSKQTSSMKIYPKKWYNSVFPSPDIFPLDWIGI